MTKILTSEELNKLKPCWATHYRYTDYEILFESKHQWLGVGLNFPFIKRGPFKHKSKLTKCKPIPEFNTESFDITKHKFSDDRLEHDGDTLNAEHQVFGNHLDGYSTEYLYLELSKDDAIALAKHFKLTASDLK